jgi:flagellar hook-associated protein 3 FlgL
MSGAIGAASGSYGLLGTVIANSTAVHQHLDTLTEQASNGLISTTYAGLGSGASVSLDLNQQVAALTTYQANINAVTGQMSVTQNAMSQLQQIAAQFAGDMPNLNGLNPSEVDSVASDAQQALQQVADLLDTQDGTSYVFAGQDTSNPPVPNPDNILTSGFYTQINAAVTSLSANGAAATTAATLQIASSNDPGTSPFSAYLSQPAAGIAVPAIDTGNGTSVPVGMLASANSATASTGTSTTGSYMRDLMRALATLGSMSSSQVNDPGFAGLVLDTQTSLNGVVSAMAQDAGVMGNRQAALTNEQTNMSDTATALAAQISNAQDVDMAATLSQLTATQTQLQASYRLITGLNSMSLVNFLPAPA